MESVKRLGLRCSFWPGPRGPRRSRRAQASTPRVEVRAKLYERAAGEAGPPVVRSGATGGQTFRLDLPTKELAELAKALDGTLVVVAGDLTIKTTPGTSFLAEPPGRDPGDQSQAAGLGQEVTRTGHQAGLQPTGPAAG